MKCKRCKLKVKRCEKVHVHGCNGWVHIHNGSHFCRILAEPFKKMK